MPVIRGLRVIRSPIHGYGVLAERDYAAGEVITEIDGVVWREGETWNDTYTLWVDEGVYLDMVDQTRWINHSCEPNAEIEGEVEADGKVWARLVAYKDVRAGEELLYDYGFPAHLAEPCACGAKTCRGWIVDEEELPRLQERLAREGRAVSGAGGSR